MKKITFSILVILALSTMTIKAQTVLIDFGSASYLPTTNWNSITRSKQSLTDPDSLSTVVDNAGATTTIKIKIKKDFEQPNTSGYSPTIGDALAEGFTGNMSKDNLFIQKNSSVLGQASLRVWGLDVSKKYSFTFFSSHQYPAAGEIKQGQLTAIGSNTASDTLNASYNKSRIKTITNITPTIDGYIDLIWEAGPDNNGSFKYAYLSALKIVGTTPVTTTIKNNNATSLSARLMDNNLVVGDYTGIVKVYTVNGKLVANGQSVFGYMPLSLQKGIYIVDTAVGKTKLVVK